MGNDPAPMALHGLKVLEVTANWAGPLAGRHLADLGAEVIKIEHASRPATRILWYVGNDPGKYHYNRSGYFNKLNRNKKAICLDLAHPAGRGIFLQLVEWADVLIENNSARVMPNLGLDYESLHMVNPRLIMASISGFGATGPERDYVAYGANIEASSGLASVTGYGDGTPYRVGSFYADPIGGNYATVAILAALHERDRSGKGQYIDISLNECAVTFFARGLLEHQLAGDASQRGNRNPKFAPQGCYPTAGVDAWLVLTIRDGDEWLKLCEVIGRSDWASDVELASPAGRHRRHDELDRGLEEWSSDQDAHEAATMLQNAGIPAAPVMRNWELLADRHLAARQFYVPIEHREAGVYMFPGMPWKLSSTPGLVRSPAPRFAEHNDIVFGGLLGLSPSEIDRMEEARVIARQPADHLPTHARP